MEEIKVNDYVRLDRNQGIRKIEEIEDDAYYLDECVYDEYGEVATALDKSELKDMVLNHSENIIDLIEVGDYVNGELISNVNKVDNMNIIEWSNGDIYKTDIQNDKFIKSIVTHEQFNSIKYEVG